MYSTTCLVQLDATAVWTEAGSNDRAAEVGVTTRPDGALAVQIAALGPDPLTFVALRWADALPDGARILGDHWEQAYGDLEWRGIVPNRSLPWYALIHDPARGKTRGVGVETGANCLASWRIDETGITLVLDTRCGGLGVKLGGRRLDAAIVRELSSSPGAGVFGFAKRFCAALCPSPRLPAQPVYGGNDWHSRYGVITADTVKQDAALIRELSPAGDNLPFSVMDAGWYPTDTDEGGQYDRGNIHYPDMAGLAGEMRGLGVRSGIWIRPLLTCGGDVPAGWRVSPKHPLAKTPDARLDPSVPEVLDWLETTAPRRWRTEDGIQTYDWGSFPGTTFGCP